MSRSASLCVSVALLASLVNAAGATPDLQIQSIICQNNGSGGRISNVTVANGGDTASSSTSLTFGVMDANTGVNTSRTVTVPPLTPGGTFTPTLAVNASHGGCCYGDVLAVTGETNTSNNYRQSSVSTILPGGGVFMLDLPVFNPFNAELVMNAEIDQNSVPAGWSVQLVTPVVVVPPNLNPPACPPDGPQCTEPIIGGLAILPVEVIIPKGPPVINPDIVITAVALGLPEYPVYGQWSWNLGSPDLTVDTLLCQNNDMGGRNSYATVKNVGTAFSAATTLEYGVVNGSQRTYRKVNVPMLAPNQTFAPTQGNVTSSHMGCCYGTVAAVTGETNTSNNHRQTSVANVPNPISGSTEFIFYNPFPQDSEAELAIDESSVPAGWLALLNPPMLVIPGLQSPTIDDGEQYTDDPLVGGVATFELELDPLCEDVPADIEINGSLIGPPDLAGFGTWSYNALVEFVGEPADLDCDGVVGPGDLARLLAAWGPCPDCPEDLDGDGAVGPADLAILLAAWG